VRVGEDLGDGLDEEDGHDQPAGEMGARPTEEPGARHSSELEDRRAEHRDELAGTAAGTQSW
jgi:hypothetical protein